MSVAHWCLLRWRNPQIRAVPTDQTECVYLRERGGGGGGGR